MKDRRSFIIRFLTPAMMVFLIIFLYPTVRTMMMSLFEVQYVTDSVRDWSFAGLENFKKLMGTTLFQRSLVNILKIWFVEGAAVIALAMLFSFIITSGIKGKSFWRAVVYMPHIISVVALVTMWTQYAFNNNYGLFKTLFEFLHLDALARYQWTAPENLFLSMMIAYGYGSVGFYVLILVAGIDGIPRDYHEAAQLDGAGAIRTFFSITLPQLKDIIKRCVVLYSAGAIGFFSYSTLFSPVTAPSTVTPIVYMYDNVFGSATADATTKLNVGAGAAVGVIVMLLVVVVNTVLDKMVPGDGAEE